MNKTAIKNFAIWARRKLIADITYKAGLIGVSGKGVAEPLGHSKPDLQFFDIGTRNYAEVAGDALSQRSAFVRAIQAKEKTSGYATAFRCVVEEVAYTWFNRLIALRFMEVNDYLPSRVRVLSSVNPAKNEPDFVTTPFETDLDFTPSERERVLRLKDENRLDELFRMLLIKQCNKLHDVLPGLFEPVSDYTELLLAVSFTDKDDVVWHLVHDIAEDDFNVAKEGQVEIIGWMYQYYNTEPKDEVFALLKKNVKITKERIPAATQLFTPDWIVRYMVENSLGRLWAEGHPNDVLQSGWKYYLEEAPQEPDVQVRLEKIRAEYRALNPEDIKLIDPCMGSGHILVCAFDVLMRIYVSCGYTERDAAVKILENNLYGLDIDERAYQLAYFAVMMKARQYDRRLFSRGVEPNLCAIAESNGANRDLLKLYDEGDRPSLTRLMDAFIDAKEYGSLCAMPDIDWEALWEETRRILDAEYDNIFDSLRQYHVKYDLLPLLKQGRIMARLYDVVVTNPPYMGSSGMSEKLSEFVKAYYPDSKSDMSTACMEKTIAMCKPTGYMAMINIPVWMFLSSYEKLRQNILTHNTIMNMVHPGRGIFGSDFGTTSFVIAKSHIPHYAGNYRRLFVKQGEVESVEVREQRFFEKRGCFTAEQDNFSKIPGSPVAYWVSEAVFATFELDSISNYCAQKTRISTGDNEHFMRMWHEVANYNLFYPNKWIPCPKGGGYRKWYGNIELILNWENDGYEIKHFPRAMLGDPKFFLKSGLTWTVISVSKTGFRIVPEGCICDHKGPLIYVFDETNKLPLLALLNSKYCEELFKVTCPTIGFEWGAISKTPWSIDNKQHNKVSEIAQDCISLSRAGWDSFETSWDFKRHPLIPTVIAQEDVEHEDH